MGYHLNHTREDWHIDSDLNRRKALFHLHGQLLAMKLSFDDNNSLMEEPETLGSEYFGSESKEESLDMGNPD